MQLLKTLASYLREYKKYALLAPLMVVLEVLCELALPLVMAKIVDVGIAGAQVPYILRMGAAMLALSLAAMAFGVLSARFSAVCSQGFGANLRQGLFDQVQEFSFADIDRFSSASLITRMTNDVNAITMMLAIGLRMLTRAPVTLVAALIVTASISPRLSLVLLAVIPVMAAAIVLLMKICSRLFEVMQKKIDNLNNTVQENLVAIRVVKAFVREGYEKTKFMRSNDELTAASLNVGMRIIAMLPIMMISLNVATVLVLWIGGRMVMNDTLLVGQLSSFISYIAQILMSVMMVAMALLQLSRAQACARRICEVLWATPDIRDCELSRELPAPRGRVEFRDVCFKYVATGTGDDVLRDVSFTVEPGQFVAIVGGTGVGKSSLVNLIPRFYDVTGGAVLLAVHDHSIGADVERLRPVSEQMRARFQASDDVSFWQLWVQRESRCKRAGISAVALRDRKVPSLPNERVFALEPFPDYTAGVCTCSDADVDKPIYLTVKELI